MKHLLLSSLGTRLAVASVLIVIIWFGYAWATAPVGGL